MLLPLVSPAQAEHLWVGSSLTCKHSTKPESLAKDKCSLSSSSATKKKKFDNFYPRKITDQQVTGINPDPNRFNPEKSAVLVKTLLTFFLLSTDDSRIKAKEFALGKVFAA
jgi:hypothetical protein